MRKAKENYLSFKAEVEAFVAEHVAPVDEELKQLGDRIADLRMKKRKLDQGKESISLSEDQILTGQAGSSTSGALQHEINALLQEQGSLAAKQADLLEKQKILQAGLNNRWGLFNRASASAHLSALEDALRKNKKALLRILGLAAMYRMRSAGAFGECPSFNERDDISPLFIILQRTGILSPEEIDCRKIMREIEGD